MHAEVALHAHGALVTPADVDLLIGKPPGVGHRPGDLAVAAPLTAYLALVEQAAQVRLQAIQAVGVPAVVGVVVAVLDNEGLGVELRDGELAVTAQEDERPALDLQV